MMRQVFKILIPLFLVFFMVSPVFAADLNCDAITQDSGPPHPLQILCPLKRGLNVAIAFVGVVLPIMIVIGGIKLALAVGDPKGLEAARGTWTWAIIGSIVILGFFTIMLIISRLLGIDNLFASPNDIFDAIQRFFEELFAEIGIS